MMIIYRMLMTIMNTCTRSGETNDNNKDDDYDDNDEALQVD